MSREKLPFCQLKELCQSKDGDWFEEVSDFIKKSTSKKPENLDLEELRMILVDYIQNELVEAKKKTSGGFE